MSQVPDNMLSSRTLHALTKAAQAKGEEELKIVNDPEEDVPVVGDPAPSEEDLSIVHEQPSEETTSVGDEPEKKEPEPEKEEADADPPEEDDKDTTVEEAPAESEPEKEDPPEDDSDKGEVTDFLSKELKGMLDQQIGNELFAFYEYKAAAAWFKRQGLDGFACWATGQANDEIDHMNKVMCFLTELDLVPTFPELDSPPGMATGVRELVEAVLDREKAVTSNWRAIGKQAMQDVDLATMDLAQWFLREQMEEEDAAKSILDKLDRGNELIVDMMLRDK